MNMPNRKHPNNCHWDDKQNEHWKMNSCPHYVKICVGAWKKKVSDEVL